MIMTIHPPTYEIFSMFTKVALMSTGRLLFYGHRREMLPYFAFIEYPCPAFKNPSDYYLDLVKKNNTSDGTIISYACPCCLLKVCNNLCRSLWTTFLPRHCLSPAKELVRNSFKKILSNKIKSISKGLLISRNSGRFIQEEAGNDYGPSRTSTTSSSKN